MLIVLDLCHLEWYENYGFIIVTALAVLDLCHLEWYENLI
mgnify:CR=1 FL=1